MKFIRWNLLSFSLRNRNISILQNIFFFCCLRFSTAPPDCLLRMWDKKLEFNLRHRILLLVIARLFTMLRRLVSIQNHELTLWKNLISCRKSNLGASVICHQNLARFSACQHTNFNSSKPNEPPQQNSVINNVLTSFKGNPYVRLMRLDRPIGNATKK